MRREGPRLTDNQADGYAAIQIRQGYFSMHGQSRIFRTVAYFRTLDEEITAVVKSEKGTALPVKCPRRVLTIVGHW